MFEKAGYKAGDMTADEAIESVLKRPELYGLCRVEERDSALARIARVEALHGPYTRRVESKDPSFCIECSGAHGADVTEWPCDTYKAITGQVDLDE